MRTDGVIESILERIRQEAPELVILQSEETDLLGERSTSGAVFSPEDDPVFRYVLWRTWDDMLPVLVVIMLNPSTADHQSDDRTIMTLIARAKACGYGGILVINLFAYRATDPSDMKKADDPIGPRNDLILEVILEINAQAPLCAWGAHGTHKDRGQEVRCRLEKMSPTPLVLRMSKQGQPEHPLYKSLSDAWFPWPEFRSTS